MKLRVGKELQIGATEIQLQALQSRSIAELKYELPRDYLDLLAETNGVSHNSLHIYAAEPGSIGPRGRPRIFEFVSANISHRDRDELREYIVFGEMPPDIYVHNLTQNTYHACDSITLTVFESFARCRDLLQYALNRSRD